MCGLKIETEHGQVIRIKGNRDDPFSKGHLCAKAMALKDIHEDSQRLRQPVKRTEQGWQPISWEAAFEEIETQLLSIRKLHGHDSIGLYLGNPSYHHHGSLLAGVLLKKSLQSRHCYSVASSDHLPHMLAAYQLFGHMAMLPVPDIDRTDYFLCFGANPLVSNGSVMGAPYIKKRFQSLQRRGGKLVTIDPRKTETGGLADQHVFIRPGSDHFLLLGMICFIVNHKLVTSGGWQTYTDGMEALVREVQPYTLERVEQETGIDKNSIETLAREFAAAEKAVAYGRVGICTQQQGSLNAWLLYVLNIITGNLDEVGGIMFPMPAADLGPLSALINEGGRFDKFRSPVNNLPSFDSELPVIEMADAMVSKEKAAMRAFINVAGNPVLSTPDGTKLEAALAQLEFMVGVDYYINETNRYAHIILPPSSPLEKSQYNMTCNLTAVRNNARYSPPLFAPSSQARHDWEILLLLSAVFNKGFSLRQWVLRGIGGIFKTIGADGVLDFILRLGPYGYSFRKRPRGVRWHIEAISKITASLIPFGMGEKLSALVQVSAFSSRFRHEYIDENISALKQPLTLKNLKNKPNGFDFGPMTPSLPRRLLTKNKKINLLPDIYLNELQTLNAVTQSREPLGENEFILIGRRTPRSMNSWLNRYDRLTKGKPANTLYMHPDDAKKMGFLSDARVTMEVDDQCVHAVLALQHSIMRGVVCLPHGWSTRQGADGQRHANFNTLTSTQSFDGVSGVSVLNNVRVKVSRPSL